MPTESKKKGRDLARKLTPSLVARKTPPYDGEGLFLGIARRYREINTTYGTSACFLGDFALRGRAPGDPDEQLPAAKRPLLELRSMKLYLPRHVESMLVEAIDAEAFAAVDKQTGEVRPFEVRFAFRLWQREIPAAEINAARSKGKVVSAPYEWMVEEVVDTRPGDVDPVAALLAEATQ